MKKRFISGLVLAIVSGIFIAWIDSRPNWDDTGITAFLVFIAAGACGYIAVSRPWLIALAVSIWIPMYGIIATQNYGSLIALIPGFAGAYAGYYVKKMTDNP